MSFCPACGRTINPPNGVNWYGDPLHKSNKPVRNTWYCHKACVDIYKRKRKAANLLDAYRREWTA